MEITILLPYFEGTHDPDLDTIVVAGHLTDAEVEQHLTELNIVTVKNGSAVVSMWGSEVGAVSQMEEVPRVNAEDGVASFLDNGGEIVIELEYHYCHATVEAPLRGK